MWGEDTHTCTDADCSARKYLAAGTPAVGAPAANVCVCVCGLMVYRRAVSKVKTAAVKSLGVTGRGVSESQRLASLAGRETAQCLTPR